MNGVNKEPIVVSSPTSQPNGVHSQGTHGSTFGCKRPRSPLKQVTNVTTVPPIFSHPSSSSQRPPSPSRPFKVPYPPIITKSIVDRSETSIPGPHSPSDSVRPKIRRGSSYTFPPRRNSFPSTHRDTLEALRALRSEAKLRKRKGSTPQTIGSPLEEGPLLTPRIPALVSNMEYDGCRHRSSTNPGISVLRKGGSHVAHVSNPRLDNLGRDSFRSTRCETLPTTLWDYLMIEMETSEVQGVEEYKKERLYNFLRIPDAFERLIFFGWLVCLDSFLHMFTILPLRVLRALYRLFQHQFSRDREERSRPLRPAERADLLKGLLMVLTCLSMTLFDASRIYHSIRGQSTIKLYVLFNVLDIADRLCCSIGQDIFDVIFSKNAVEPVHRHERIIRWIRHIFLGFSYNLIHSCMLFFQVVTLNVAVNSYSNALLSLLMSNQFVEIKATVFKKFEKENLFQMSCADIVERFHLSLLLVLIIFRNLIEHTNSLTTPLNLPWMNLCMPFIMVLGSELLVDWCKHAFITKFNHIRPSIYGRFTDVLCLDFVKEGREAYVDQSPAVSKRMGLPTIPLACLTLRTMGQTIQIFKQNHLSKASSTTLLAANASLGTSSPSPTSPLRPLDATLRRIVSLNNDVGWEVWFITNGLYLVGFILGFIALLLLKLFIGIYLLKFARSRMAGMASREEGERQWDEGPRKVLNAGKGNRGGVEIEEQVRKLLDSGEDDLLGLGRGDQGKGLLRVERYSMVSKRIW